MKFEKNIDSASPNDKKQNKEPIIDIINHENFPYIKIVLAGVALSLIATVVAHAAFEHNHKIEKENRFGGKKFEEIQQPTSIEDSIITAKNPIIIQDTPKELPKEIILDAEPQPNVETNTDVDIIDDKQTLDLAAKTTKAAVVAPVVTKKPIAKSVAKECIKGDYDGNKSKQGKKMHMDEAPECMPDPDETPNPKCNYAEIHFCDKKQESQFQAAIGKMYSNLKKK